MLLGGRGGGGFRHPMRCQVGQCIIAQAAGWDGLLGVWCMEDRAADCCFSFLRLHAWPRGGDQ